MTVTLGPVQQLTGVFQKFGGTSTAWNDLGVPLPINVVVIASDTLDIKIGNGVDTYANLPVWLNLQDLLDIGDTLQSLQQQLATKLDEGSIKSVLIMPGMHTYPDITTDTFTPSLSVGTQATARITSTTHALQIVAPIVQSGRAMFDIEFSADTDTLVSFSPGIQYLGNSGRIIHPGQTYLYSFRIEPLGLGTVTTQWIRG